MPCAPWKFSTPQPAVVLVFPAQPKDRNSETLYGAQNATCDLRYLSCQLSTATAGAQAAFEQIGLRRSNVRMLKQRNTPPVVGRHWGSRNYFRCSLWGLAIRLHLIFLFHRLLGTRTDQLVSVPACSQRSLQLASGRLGREALACIIFNAVAAHPELRITTTRTVHAVSKTAVCQANPKIQETSRHFPRQALTCDSTLLMTLSALQEHHVTTQLSRAGCY